MRKLKHLSMIATMLLICLFAVNCSKDSISENNLDLSEMTKSEMQEFLNKIAQEAMVSERMIGFEEEFDTVPNDGEGGICPMRNMSDEVSEPSEVSLMSSLTEKLYDIRDNILEKTEIGKSYINAYYYIGGKLKEEGTTTQDIAKAITVAPTFFTIYNNLKDENYKGAVIDENQKNKLIDFVEHYKSKRTNDANYQNVLNVVIEDIKTLTNRSSSQINDFLSL